jgi:hypothetical protein
MTDIITPERATPLNGGFGGRSGASHPEPEVTTWPHLAEGLYSFLTGRGATIEYTFDNLEVWVPRDTAPDSPAAHWKLHGTIRMRTSEAEKGGR